MPLFTQGFQQFGMDGRVCGNNVLEIDLPSQEIRRPNGSIIKFEIDPFRKKCLLRDNKIVANTLITHKSQNTKKIVIGEIDIIK